MTIIINFIDMMHSFKAITTSSYLEEIDMQDSRSVNSFNRCSECQQNVLLELLVDPPEWVPLARGHADLELA